MQKTLKPLKDSHISNLFRNLVSEAMKKTNLKNNQISMSKELEFCRNRSELVKAEVHLLSELEIRH